MKTLLTVALLASALAAPVSAAELVLNGGFEDSSGLGAGWSYTVSQSLKVQFLAPAAAHSGDASLRMAADDVLTSDYLYQNLTTVVGQTYDYSFWLRNGTTDAEAPSLFSATIGSDVMAAIGAADSFGYKEYSGKYTATSSTTKIYFEAYNSLGLYQLDDVSVRSPSEGDCNLRIGCTGGGGVPEPASWALMLLGFGGVGAMLRRRPRVQIA